MEEIEDIEHSEIEHDRLISAVTKLDRTQHIKQPTRNEPTNRSTEFNLIKKSKKLDFANVIKVLEDTPQHVQISKKLQKTHDKANVLAKPLEKPQAERIKRSAGYEETKIKVGRWDPVVARSRTVDHVSFPLKHASSKLQPTTEFLSKFKLKSPLELELDEVDPPPVVEEEEDEEQTYPMSYEEMLEHRQHSAKMRAQQSFKAAKAKRQSKIKSKKYHRILKKERLKIQLKEFEELQQTDPEEALKKLEGLEKARALERHTLRHKNTGKWAKNLLVRAKYDKDVRQQLAEQLAVSRGLTQKTTNSDSTDEDEPDETEDIPDLTLTQDPNNPWMLKTAKKSYAEAEFDFGYKKYLRENGMFKRNDIDSDSEEEQTNIVANIINTEFPNLAENPVEDLILKESLHKIKKVHGETNEDKSIVDLKKGKSKNKNNQKPQKRKLTQDKPTQKTKKAKAVGTSEWEVESLEPQKDEIRAKGDINEEFESLESDIMTKVERKLQVLRKNLEKMERESTKETQKNKPEVEETDSLEYLKMQPQKIKAVLDKELVETTSKDAPEVEQNSLSRILNADINTGGKGNSNANIDPSQFIEAKPKYLNSALSSGEIGMDALDDEQVVPKVNIEDVFEEDDVVASFRQEKEDEAKKDQPEDIDLSLPGWGSWGGKGVKVSKRKKNRFILKAPPKVERRDENKGDIIIKEFKDPKLAVHKVKDVPFPFTSVKEYEASIRAPLGNTFITERAHKKLIRPSVFTKAGTIIEPMDEEELLVPKNKSFKNEKVLTLLGTK